MSLIYFIKFELTASGGVEICCLLVPPWSQENTSGADEFCMVLVSSSFAYDGALGEKLQVFCLSKAFW